MFSPSGFARRMKTEIASAVTETLLYHEQTKHHFHRYARSAVQKEDRHHIGEPEFVQPQRSMSCIGG